MNLQGLVANVKWIGNLSNGLEICYSLRFLESEALFAATCGKVGPCYISLHRPTVVVFSKVSIQYLSSCILFCTVTLPLCHEEVASVASTPLQPGGSGTALTNRQSGSAAAHFQHSPWLAWDFDFCFSEASQSLRSSSIP